MFRLSTPMMRAIAALSFLVACGVATDSQAASSKRVVPSGSSARRATSSTPRFATRPSHVSSSGSMSRSVGKARPSATPSRNVRAPISAPSRQASVAPRPAPSRQTSVAPRPSPSPRVYSRGSTSSSHSAPRAQNSGFTTSRRESRDSIGKARADGTRQDVARAPSTNHRRELLPGRHHVEPGRRVGAPIRVTNRPAWLRSCYRDIRPCSRPIFVSPHYSRAYHDRWTYFDSPVIVHREYVEPSTYIVEREIPVVVEQPVAAAPYEATVQATPIAPAQQVQPPGDPSESQPASSPFLDEGVFELKQGNFAGAQRAFLQATMESPVDGFATLFYGIATLMQGDDQLAAAAIRRALGSTPELITDPIDLRTLFANESDLTGQMSRLAGQVENISPPNPNAQFLLGYLHLATADPHRAHSVLAGLVALNPDDALAAQLRDAAWKFATEDRTTVPE